MNPVSTQMPFTKSIIPLHVQGHGRVGCKRRPLRCTQSGCCCCDLIKMIDCGWIRSIHLLDRENWIGLVIQIVGGYRISTTVVRNESNVCQTRTKLPTICAVKLTLTARNPVVIYCQTRTVFIDKTHIQTGADTRHQIKFEPHRSNHCVWGWSLICITVIGHDIANQEVVVPIVFRIKLARTQVRWPHTNQNFRSHTPLECPHTPFRIGIAHIRAKRKIPFLIFLRIECEWRCLRDRLSVGWILPCATTLQQQIAQLRVHTRKIKSRDPFHAQPKAHTVIGHYKQRRTVSFIQIIHAPILILRLRHPRLVHF